MACLDQIYNTLQHIGQLLEQLLDKITHFIIVQEQKPFDNTPEVWLNANEVRQRLHMSERTYHRRIQAGLLVGKIEVGRRLFSQEEISRFMQKEQNRKWKRS